MSTAAADPSASSRPRSSSSSTRPPPVTRNSCSSSLLWCSWLKAAPMLRSHSRSQCRKRTVASSREFPSAHRASTEKPMRTDATLEQYRDLLRQDPYAFTERAFAELKPQTRFLRDGQIEVLVAKLEDVRRGRIRRLIINVPPRSLKSHCASVAFPAWLLGHDSTVQILAVSYGQDLADKLARECRALISSPFFKALL